MEFQAVIDGFNCEAELAKHLNYKAFALSLIDASFDPLALKLARKVRDRAPEIILVNLSPGFDLEPAGTYLIIVILHEIAAFLAFPPFDRETSGGGLL